tara:strand:- start:715 stop:1875 length:1161 start_codon:yes stop_codon:yes gene_type:complete
MNTIPKMPSIGGCLTPGRSKKEKEQDLQIQKQDLQIQRLKADHDQRNIEVNGVISQLHLALNEAKNAVDQAQKDNKDLYSITTKIKEQVNVIKEAYDQEKKEHKEVQLQLIELKCHLGQLEKSFKESEEKTERIFDEHMKRIKKWERIVDKNVNKKDEKIERLTKEKLNAHEFIQQLVQDRLNTQARLDEFERKLGQLTQEVAQDRVFVRYVDEKCRRLEAKEDISNKAAKEKAKLTVLRLIEKKLERSVEDNLLNDIEEIINIAESIEERKEYLDSDKCKKWKSICNRKKGWLDRIRKVWSGRDKNLEDVGNEMAALSEDSMGGSQPIHLEGKYKELYHIIDIIGLVKSDGSNADSGVSNYLLEIIEGYKNRGGVEESKREDDRD